MVDFQAVDGPVGVLEGAGIVGDEVLAGAGAGGLGAGASAPDLSGPVAAEGGLIAEISNCCKRDGELGTEVRLDLTSVRVKSPCCLSVYVRRRLFAGL